MSTFVNDFSLALDYGTFADGGVNMWNEESVLGGVFTFNNADGEYTIGQEDAPCTTEIIPAITSSRQLTRDQATSCSGA